MQTIIPDIASPVLVVTGMHRSGTSLTASILSSLGINLGTHLIQPDAFNVKGYFEDADFVEFQRSVLRNCCPAGESGWPDWGWTESEFLDKSNYQNYLAAALNLINSRRQTALPWGWKDPRTSLMLDFWRELLPEARFLFVYRFPWDVADSILRLNSPIFSQHPDYALKIWAFYNRHILEFRDRYPERSLLVNINSIAENPSQLFKLVQSQLNLPELPGTQEREIYDARLLKSLDWEHPLVKLLQAIAPQYFSLLDELDRAADIPSKFSEKASDRSPEALVFSLYQSNYLGAKHSRLEICDKPTTFVREYFSPIEELAKNEIALSVIIPCYNQGEFILDAISSVEECLEDVWELVIVNDGSTEPLTLQTLDYLKKQGYCIIEQTNQGLAAARNQGIAAARGRYILPLDADNKIRPDYITKAIEILDKLPEVGVVYGNAECFGEQTGVWEVPDFELNRLLCGNYIDACAVFRKAVWQQCGGYDSHIPEQLGFEDWDFWLSAAENGWQFYRIPQVLFDYRVRARSMVSACSIPENRRKLVRYICAKHRKLYTTDSRFADVIAQKEFDWLWAILKKNNED